MLIGTSGSWDLAVGNIAREHVSERVLRVGGDRRPLLAADEFLPLEAVQSFLSGPRLNVADPCHGPQPEDLSNHSRVLEEGLLLFAQRVQTRRDDPLDRLGKRRLAVSDREVSVGHHPRKLLGVQRISPGTLKQRRLRLGRQDRPLEKGREQVRRLFVVQRRERERQRIGLPSAPSRSAGQQLRSSSADDEDRNAGCPFDEVIDEIEEPFVSPVQVLEDEDEWPLLGDCLEEAPPGGEGFRTVVTAQLMLAFGSDQRPQAPGDPVRIVALEKGRSARTQPLLRVLTRVRLEDSRLRLDDLAERPE